MKENINVLYIAGCGRSGSTLLERILGEIEDFFTVGELGLVWERGFIENQLCGCGQPFSDCSFWKRVVSMGFGRIDPTEINKILFLRNKVMRTRHIPLLLSERLRSKEYNLKLKELTDILGIFYSEIQKQSQARVIVDSTKFPLYALLLSNIRDINLHVLHLVRNNKAVAYSWQRKRLRPEIENQTEFMPQYSVYKSSKEWNKSNYLSMLLRYRPVKYHLLRYEDFIRNPQQKLNDILASFQIEVGDISKLFKNDLISFKKKSHTVSGNPMRFQTGEIEIRADDEWENKLPLKDQIISQMLTYPLAKFIGY